MKKLLFILLLIIPFVGFGQDWEVFFGGPGRQYGGSVQQTSDGGYVFCGYESGGDIHLVKIDSVGNQQWNQIFVGNDGGNSVKQTNDGGYIICGGTTIIKTDVNGNFQWSQSYGTTYKTSIEQTNNGGYIISGVSYDTITNQENIILIKTDNIIIDSKSGYSGAGRGVHNKYKDKNLYESLSAYGVGFHRHNSEIQQEINNYTKKKFSFTFTPHLTPMLRGILSTIYVDLNKGVSIKKLENTLKSQYSKNRFVKILKTNSLLSTNDVINTNNCSIVICKTKYKNRVIILSVIDNLIKGGAGQAIQNMNIKYGFNETKGLI